MSLATKGSGNPREEDVKDFIFRLRLTLAEDSRCSFIGRNKNLEALADLGMFESEVPAVLRSLRPETYCEGPMPDDQGRAKEWWVFGPIHEGKLLYIKVGIQRGRVECLSFHKAQYPLIYPLRRGGGKK